MIGLLPLLSVLIVIVGFALKFDAVLIIMVALIVTAFTDELGLASMLETLGTTFVNNRGMAIFIIIMSAIGTLERNGLKESAATLIKRFRKVSAGVIIGIYGVFRIILATFNVSFDGVAGFVRPIILPTTLETVELENLPAVPECEEELKRVTSAMENICWFSGQVLFVGGVEALLIQSTLKDLGYEVTLGKLTLVEVPVTLVALVPASTYFTLKEKRLRRKYYGQEGLKWVFSQIQILI